MANKITLTMLEAVDKAVEELPFLRRRITQRAFRRDPNLKIETAERVMLAMYESDKERVEACCPGIVEGFGTGAVAVDTPFQIDLDNLERFLQIVLEYLPQILELVLKFLPLFISLAAFLLGSLVASNVGAQTICSDGSCSLAPQAASVSYFSSGGKTYRVIRRPRVVAPVVRSALTPVRSIVSQPVVVSSSVTVTQSESIPATAPTIAPPLPAIREAPPVIFPVLRSVIVPAQRMRGCH